MDSTLENPLMDPPPPPEPKETPQSPEVTTEPTLETEAAPLAPKEKPSAEALSPPAGSTPQESAPVASDTEVPAPSKGAPQEAPAPTDAGPGVSEQAFTQWSWGTASKPPALDPKATTLSACTGVSYDYVAADVEAAAWSADDLVVARCLKALPTTAEWFSDPARDPLLLVNLPSVARYELAIKAVAAGQKDVYFVRQNAAQNTLTLGVVGGFSLAGPAAPNTDQDAVTISDHSTQLQAALPQDGTGREVIEAFREPKGASSEQAQNTQDSPPQRRDPVARDSYRALDFWGDEHRSETLLKVFGPEVVNDIEDELAKHVLGRHPRKASRHYDKDLVYSVKKVLRAIPEAVEDLLHYPDKEVRDAARSLQEISNYETRARVVSDSLQALVDQDQRSPLTPELLNQMSSQNGLGALYIHSELLFSMVRADMLPPSVLELEDRDDYDGYISLSEALNVGRSLSAEQQKAFFSIIRGGRNQLSLFEAEEMKKTPLAEEAYQLLADAVIAPQDKYAYLSSVRLLEGIGGKDLPESFETFLYSASKYDYKPEDQGFAGSTQRVVSDRRQDIALRQTLDLNARARDRDIEPGKLGTAEGYTSRQSQDIEYLVAEDGSPPTLKGLTEVYARYLVQELDDWTLTEEARDRLEGARRGLLALFGVPLNSNLKTVLSNLTEEDWARFAEGVQTTSAVQEGTFLPGQAALVDMAKWWALRTPDGARLFAEQDSLLYKAKETFRELEEEYSLTTRSVALVGLIAAVMQGSTSVVGLSAGLASSGTGIGAVPGVVLMAISAGGLASAVDLGQASLLQLITGDAHGTLTEELVDAAAKKLGISPDVISALGFALSFVNFAKFGPEAASQILGIAKKGGEKLADVTQSGRALADEFIDETKKNALTAAEILSTPLTMMDQRAFAHQMEVGLDRLRRVEPPPSDKFTYESRADRALSSGGSAKPKRGRYVDENGTIHLPSGGYAVRLEDGSYDLHLTYKSGWSDFQRQQADAKIAALTEAKTYKSPPGSRARRSKPEIENRIGPKPEWADADHRIDLQLGGQDVLGNLWWLESSVNRSLGSQIKHLIRDIPEGTPIRNFTIRERS